MPTDFSFLFPKKFSPNAKKYYSTRFAGVTPSGPDRFSPDGDSAWRAFVGTDALTGFSIADLAAQPFACRPIGGVPTNQGGFAIYGISHLNPGVPDFPTLDLAGWNTRFDASIAEQIVEGVPTNALSIRIKDTGPSGSDPSGGFKTQLWGAHVYRDLLFANADLTEICYEFVFTLPDLINLLTTSAKYFTFFDVKTGLPGDHRLTFGAKMAAGEYEDNGLVGPASNGILVWYCQSDSRGSAGIGADIPSPENYFRYINNKVSVPAANDPFRMRIYVKRASSFSDFSGRYRIEIFKSDGTHAVLFDCTEGYAAAWNAAHPIITAGAAQPAMNVTMGKFNRWVERIYIGTYFGGKANQDVTSKIAAVDFWDGYPDILPDPAI